MNPPRTRLERLTKPTIVVSLVAAVWTQRTVTPFPELCVAAFVLAWTAGRFWPALARPVALFAIYLAPLIFVVTRGRFVEAYGLVWIVILCGLIFSTPGVMRWSLPEKWKLPLVYWGLIVALTWPVINLREVDFDLSQLRILSQWAGTVAIGVMVGILWFDWLFSVYGSADRPSLEREILLPLGLGWMVAASIGLYQMFGQMTFLNPGFWAYLRRSTGSFGDANVLSVLSVMWGPALVAVASSWRNRWASWWVAAVALPLSGFTIWASGSRSALPFALLGLLAVIAALWRSTRHTRGVSAAAVAVVAVMALGGLAVVGGDTFAVGPIGRFTRDFAPRLSVEWAGEMATRLWTREGYGTVAIDMVRRFPAVGVGLSSYYDLAHVFSWPLLGKDLPFDNAQNWYRHELAELGIVGSLGWVVWTVTFVSVLLTARARPGRQLSETIIRVVLVGFGLISLVGMPGQSGAVALTFWTLAFWFLRDAVTGPEDDRQPPKLVWAAVWLLVIGHTAGTAYVAWAALRPPVRMQWANLDYSLGFYDPEGGGSEAFRWAKHRAVAVLPAPKPWMEVSVRVDYPDLERQPVDVKVWIDRTLTLRTRLRTVEPVTRYVRVPADRRVMIETWVSRVHSPEAGVRDSRERGLLVRWNFVDAPPPNATIARR